MCPPLTTCGGRLQRLFADWIYVVCSVDGTSMCHYSAFAGLTNEAYAGLALPDVMPGLTRYPVKHPSQRDTFT